MQHASFRVPVFCACVVSAVAVGGIKRRIGLEGDEITTTGASSIAVSSSSSSSSRGVRARIAQANADAVASSSSSDANGPLVQNLKELWAKGRLSSVEVQRLALNAMKQGCEGMDKMAGIGNSGANPQNLHRGLCALFNEPAGSPGIDWIEIPTKEGPRAPHPVIWPHRFFATYREGNFEKWVKVVRGVKGGPREF